MGAHLLTVEELAAHSHTLSTGYQAGKWEGLIHFDNRTLEPIGGTITCTVLEW